MSTNRRRKIIGLLTGLIATLAMVGAVACSDDPTPVVGSGECESDEDCDGDEYCDLDSNSCEDPEDGDSTTNGDDFEPCEAHGEECDTAEIDHGEFWCLSELADEGGECVAKCDRPGRLGQCPLVSDGTYCLELDAEGRAGCYPSECSTDADCEGGTCANYGAFGNNFGRCFADGDTQSGDSCSGGPGGKCAEGSLCLSSEDGLEACRSLCNPWSGGGCMSWNEVCRPMTADLGFCTDNIDTQSSDAFDPCYTQGAWCSDAVQCMAAGAGYMCMRYCRANRGDCDQITDEDTRCNPYIIPGTDTGLCLPPCEADSDCADTEVCVDETCRVSCLSDEACCPESNPDCASICANGYCM